MGDRRVRTNLYTVDSVAQVSADVALVRNLVLEEPVGSTLSSAHPTLKWQNLPEADHYLVKLHMNLEGPGVSGATSVFLARKTNNNHLRVTEPLGDCLYGWRVYAYNSKGTLIAESPGRAEFTVTGQGKCR